MEMIVIAPRPYMRSHLPPSGRSHPQINPEPIRSEEMAQLKPEDMEGSDLSSAEEEVQRPAAYHVERKVTSALLNLEERC